MNVENLASRVVEALNAAAGLLPAGIEASSAEVLNGDDRKKARKKKGNAAIENISGGDSIYITLRRVGGRPAPSAGRAAQPSPTAAAAIPTPVSRGERVEELIRALAQAEQAPGHSFVSLKWFRDQFLTQQSLSWVADPANRHNTLREAIDRGWILLDRLANPKNPAFPTTALRLNRAKPEVQSALGQTGKLGWDFKPIVLKGEPMSETVRRMRDERY